MIRILDRETRLIAPTDPEGVETDDDSIAHTEAGQKYFQLTHDYLVQSLRTWVTRKQRETRKGRAELRLAERSAAWNAKPENRQLPSWWEHLNIRLFTVKSKWTERQRRMMVKAGRVHGIRTTLVTLLLFLVGFVGLNIRNSVVEARADGLVNSLINADTAQVPAVVANLKDVRQWANPRLKAEISEAASGSTEKLHLAIALLPVDGSQIEYLIGQLPICTLEQFPVVRESLLPHKDKVKDTLWQLVQDEKNSASQRFQAAMALAAYDPDDELWKDIAPFVTQHLTGDVSPMYFGQWLRLLQGASDQFTASLTGILADRSRSEKQRESAALVLADYWQDKPEKLAEVVLIADEFAEFSPLVNALRPHSATVKQSLLAEMRAMMPANPSDKHRDAQWKRQSMAAVTLVHLGHGNDVWPLLEFTTDPSLRSFIIFHLKKLQADHNLLAAGLESESDVTTRRALIQSLGGLKPARIPSEDRQRITERLLTLFTNDSDPGIHGSASWALRQWGVPLPELPTGRRVQTEEQERHIAELTADVEVARQRLTAYEQEELPERQAAWERKLQEQPTPAALNKGLVAHYPLDEFKEEKTANAVEGQPSGDCRGFQAKRVPGVAGHALKLNGTGEHVNCGTFFGPERTDAFSYGCWFRTRRTEYQALIAKMDSELGRGFDLVLRGSRIEVNLRHEERSDEIKVQTAMKVDDNQWHHVFVTYDGNSKADGVRIFFDGQPSQVDVRIDGLTKTIRCSVPLSIGKRSDEYEFKGMIDEVRIYDWCLQEEHVSQLYQLSAPALARLPSENRQPDQQALLTTLYHAQDDLLHELESQLAATEAALRDARWNYVWPWYVNSQGQTMVVLRDPTESQRIDHTFAISSHEVTVTEFRRFPQGHSPQRAIAPTDDCPIHAVSWYAAAEYCNWLSQQEEIPEDQWVYEPNEEDRYSHGMKIKENFLELQGYRLPTATEWEHACRAGTTGTYGFGEPEALLKQYGYYDKNSSGRTYPVESLLPNAAGMFDMHGNLWEWCQNVASGSMSPVRNADDRVLRGGSFLSRSSFGHSGHRHKNHPGNSPNYYGFRPAKTYDLSP